MRVGVLTFHRPINYGSYWQARCLLEGLTALGHDAELLDHDSPETRIAEARLSLRPTLPTPVATADIGAYKAKIRAFAEPLCRLPKSARTPLERLDALDPYDAVVVGSDEVWNLAHPVYGGRAPFFGVGLPAPKVISYAASFGNSSCWNGLPRPYPELLDRFDAISVRDENSWWMLKHALGRELPLVLDPCLAFPPPTFEARNETPYALVYGHNFSDSFATEVSAWATRRSLKLVSVGYRADWADESRIEVGPIEFAGLVQRAEAVATNFFHGCVFALRYGKPFACETTEYREIKVRGLMEAVGGMRHLVREGEALGDRMCAPIEPRVFDCIAALRADSLAYLDAALA